MNSLKIVIPIFVAITIVIIIIVDFQGALLSILNWYLFYNGFGTNLEFYTHTRTCPYISGLWGASIVVLLFPFLKISLAGSNCSIEISLWGPLFCCSQDPTSASV